MSLIKCVKDKRVDCYSSFCKGTLKLRVSFGVVRSLDKGIGIGAENKYTNGSLL